MNIIFIIFFVAVVIIIFYLLWLIKNLTDKKFVEFSNKLEVSSQVNQQLKEFIFNTFTNIQNHINQTINQITTTDTNLRFQLETLRNSINEQISNTIKNLNLQIKTTTDATTNSFKLVSQQIDERLKGTTEIFSQITEMLSKFSSSAEQLKENTEELLRSISSIKLRGNFGEVLLKKILLEVFPEDKVKFDYHVNPHSPEKVEAAVIFKDKVFPIDSKFNIDKFIKLEEAADEISEKKAERELAETIKEEIDSISTKYVLPQYGAEFGFMYIPSESGFLKIMNLKLKDGESIIKYAINKKVIITSPQTLVPYLHFVIMGIQAEQIARNVLYLRKQIDALQNSINKFAEKYSTLGRHLKNAYEKYTEVEADLKMIDIQVKNIVSMEIEKLPEGKL